MSILLILSLFVIWLSWTPAVHAYVEPSMGAMLLLGGFSGLVLVVRILNRRAMQSPGFDRFDHAVRAFNRRMSVARFAIPAWFAVGVFAFGWGATVHRMLGPAGQDWVELPGVLIGLLPPLAAWVGLWWSQFEIDRALREQNVLAQLDRDLPVFAPSPFRAYVGNRFRTQILFTLVPLLLIFLLHDLTTLAVFASARKGIGHSLGLTWPMSDVFETSMHMVCSGVVLLVSPLLIRRVLPTQRLGDSPLRQRLEQLCSRSGLKCRDILLWRTQNNMGNALVMGVFARVRYVMLSDLLLATMTDEQIEAVFAHELGHIHHRHLVWFLVMFCALAAIFTALGTCIDLLLGTHLPQGQWFALLTVAATGGLFVIAYGMLSRRFERQADVFAARTIQQSSSANEPSQPVRVTPAGPVGSHVFASALEQIAVVNNISIVAPNWTHGSIATRMRFIRQLGRSADAAEQFDRHSRRLRRLLVTTLVIAAAALAWTLMR